MAALQKNDFIAVSYTGKTDDGVFDTTDEKVAKDNEIYSPRAKYGAMTICLGQGQIIPGLDTELVGKEIGKEYSFTIPPEHAFGKKDPKAIQLIATSKFKKADINPMPGMQVNVDDQMGIIKTVSGGRTLVDFNHPLSGKTVTYTITVERQITDVNEQVGVLMGAMLQVPPLKATVVDAKATIEVPFPVVKEVQDLLAKKITEVIPAVKDVVLVNSQKDAAQKDVASADATPKNVTPDAQTPEAEQGDVAKKE